MVATGVDTVGGAVTAGSAQPLSDRRSQLSWAMFEFARTPYVGLVAMFVFAPYFAGVVVGDPVHGQEVWGISNTIAGLCIALLAPFFGAIADRLGRRKPWLITIVAIMAPCCFLLWFAMPLGMGGLPIVYVAALVILLSVSFEFGQVFHNSMLPYIAPSQNLGWLSGVGVAMGNIGNLIAMLFVLAFIALPASNAAGFSFLPDAPLFGLNAEAHEHDRIVGPISGVWLVLFTIPLILWTRDRPSTNTSASTAVREGLFQVWVTVKRARELSNVGLYLLARMLYNDGTTAILAYSGIIAAGVFKWELADLILFSIVLSPFTIAGGFVGGWLDRRIGSKLTIILAILSSCVFLIGAVSMTPEKIFFVMPVDTAQLWSFPYFQTWPEVLFIANYMALGFTVTIIYVASRAMLAGIAPASMVSQFFGLYALSGTATVFIGHALVTVVTRISHNQQVGFSSILILLLAGAALLTRVRPERAKDVTADTSASNA